MKIRSCGITCTVLAEHLSLAGLEYLVEDPQTGERHGVLAHLVHPIPEGE